MQRADYQVKVTNQNDFTLEDRANGNLYRIEPGKSVNIPYADACHIFGVDFAPGEGGKVDPGQRDAIFSHLQRRWGWNRKRPVNPDDDKSERNTKYAVEAFKKITFTLIAMQIVERVVVAEEQLKKPRAARGDKKTQDKGLKTKDEEESEPEVLNSPSASRKLFGGPRDDGEPEAEVA